MSIYGGEREWCEACGTVTSSGDCDCTRMGTGTQNLHNYADTLLKQAQELAKTNDELREMLKQTRNYVDKDHYGMLAEIDALLSRT